MLFFHVISSIQITPAFNLTLTAQGRAAGTIRTIGTSASGKRIMNTRC